jgi:hypothetical protein
MRFAGLAGSAMYIRCMLMGVSKALNSFFARANCARDGGSKKRRTHLAVLMRVRLRGGICVVSECRS